MNTKHIDGPAETVAGGRGRLTIAIVNDYPVVVKGLDAMLEPFADRVRVAELVTCGAPDSSVDVTLYDTFGARPGPQASIEAILADPGHGPVIAYSWQPAPPLVDKALALGCAGYVDKSASAQQIVDAVERVAAGERGVRERGYPPVAAAPTAGSWPGKHFGLSPREAEVLSFISQGLTNQDICERAYLSINTVKSYIRAAYHKVGVSTRSEAVRWGIEHGLLPVHERLLR